MTGDTARILIADDEQEVADVYALRLEEEYETVTAYGGEAALEAIDESVDVALLDRRMPDRSGDEVLAEIRDRGIDCRVVMITAVDPDFDIVEMPFDDYLCKPVGKGDLVAAIEQQRAAERYDERMNEYLELTSKIALLEAEKTAQELADSDEIDDLRARADELRDELDGMIASLDDVETAFRDIGRHIR